MQNKRSKTARIAIIGDRGIPARYSGFSTLVEETAVRLVNDHDMDVTVYCRNQYYQDKPPEYHGVKCVYLPAPGGKSFESIIHSNLSVLHACCFPFDLAFVVDPGNAPFVLPLLARRIPVVFHTDGLGWKRQKWSPLQRRYYKWSEKVCARLAAWLVTDSRAMQQYYVDEYRAPSSFIPYSGVVGKAPSADALARYGLNKKGYYLAVARVEPENNVLHIIREYKASGAERPLVVVGGIRYESDYAREVRREAADERVIFVPGVYESEVLNGLYRYCYAYLHGHEVGGTNPSLLRAMHAGAACVPVDVVFHREVLGESGRYFSLESGQLSGLIDQLESGPEVIEALGRLACERSRALYRWDAVAAGYAELFLTILEAKRTRSKLAEVLTDEVYRPWEYVDGEPA